MQELGSVAEPRLCEHIAPKGQFQCVKSNWVISFREVLGSLSSSDASIFRALFFLTKVESTILVLHTKLQASTRTHLHAMMGQLHAL